MNDNQIQPKMNVKEYIDQFNIIDTKNDINCDYLSVLFYGTILNKFKTTFDKTEYYYFKEYQERVFDLVENLRELSSATVPMVFDYLNQVNHYLVDIIIMLWCLPRTDNFLSKRIYNNHYKQNIQKYNYKLTKNITHECMKNFCIETLTKTNNVPTHCIDYIWFYMNTISMEFSFYNMDSGSFIGFIMPEHDDDNYIDFGFNMEYLLEIGLGQIAYENDPSSKGSFRNFLKNFVTDTVMVKKLLVAKTNQNYRKQLLAISKNPSKYFGDVLIELPTDILEVLKE